MSEKVPSTTDQSSTRGVGRQTPAHIAGVGAVTGYGWGRKHIWDGFLLGESAVKLVSGLEEYVDGGEAYIATVSDEGDRRDGPSRYMRALRFSAREAVTDALERGWEPGPVVGVVHSLVLGDVDMWSDFYRSDAVRIRPRHWVNLMPSTAISQFMKEFDFHGPSMAVSAMCASANAGMITAKSWLDSGIASDVILIATDLSLLSKNLRPFADIGAAVLNRPPLDGCRPFQEGSRGFVGGEAAVTMVLSSGATGSYASVLGGAMTMDTQSAYMVIPESEELRRCFLQSVAAAGVDPTAVAYINAHGPGTAQCDMAEALLLNELFPGAQGIFSVKPLVGHCQSAAAAAEILATIYAFQTGYIPAPRQVAPGHPKLVDGRTKRAPGPMLKSSIGFGGYNTAIILDQPTG